MKEFKDTSVAKIIKNRLECKDMETYFEDKIKAFLEKLKKDTDI